MDIYSALHSDHQQLRRLLERLEETTELNDETTTLLLEVRDLLIPHARAEEEVFYNTIRQLEPDNEVVMHGFEEHVEAEALLRSLQAATVIGTDWTEAAHKLRHAVSHHIQEEETLIFPVAQRLFRPDEAHQMGEAFVSLKPQIRDGGMVKDAIQLVTNLMPPRLRSQTDAALHQRLSA